MKFDKNMPRNQAGNIFLHILIAVAIIVVLCSIAWRIYDLRNGKSSTVLNTSSLNNTLSTPSSTASTTSSGPTVSAGTDNASLNSSLNSVNSLLSAQASDSSSLSAAINDSQNEITVPTN
jgi:hypothetical protein